MFKMVVYGIIGGVLVLFFIVNGDVNFFVFI